jgi:hypothetical protein
MPAASFMASEEILGAKKARHAPGLLDEMIGCF